MTDGQDKRMVEATGDAVPDAAPVEPAEIGGNVYLLPSSLGAAVRSRALDQQVERPALQTSSGILQSDDPDPQSLESPDADDWAWVQEWRDGHERTPWVTGLPLSAFAALVVAVAIWVLSAGLSDRPVVAVLVNLLVAGGLAPAIWLSRGLPVLRWIAAGCAAGVVVGWISAILMLPLPA